MTIFDIINIDLKKYSKNDFSDIYDGTNSQGDDFIDYEKFIFPKILNIFDSIQLKIFSEEFEIEKNTYLSFKLFAKRKNPTTNQIKELVNLIHKYFGKDSDDNTAWTSKDILDLKNGIFNRTWNLLPDGKSVRDFSEKTYFVSIGYVARSMSTIYSEPEYFSLSINGINKIIDKPINPIELPEILIKDSKQNKEGCFIATACYGDYNSPQVLVFRKYRDEKLKKSEFGKLVIKTYYFFSPFFAHIIENSELLKMTIIKTILNPLQKLIEKKSTKR